MANWFTQNAPKAPSAPSAPGSSWFASNAPTDAERFPALVNPPTPARAEDFLPEPPEGSAAGRFASNAWSMVNPIEMIRGLGHAALNPIDTAKGLVSAQVGEFGKALDSFQQGRYSEAIGHGTAGLLPVLGPVAANVGEQIGEGDVAGGLGAATGLVGGVLAPGAIGRAMPESVTARIPGFRNRNPLEVEAVKAGIAAGVPVDAATATGSRVVRAAQHVSDRSLGGGTVAQRAAEAQARGLATMGEQLAAKGHKRAVTPEQAGQGMRSAVLERVREHAGSADEAYGRLRAIEADPANRVTITQDFPEGSSAGAQGKLVRPPGRFAQPGSSIPDLFEGVLGDARRHGFTGSADDLKLEFYERVRQARELGAVTAEAAAETGPAALLSDIRQLGGIKPFTKDLGSGRKMRGDFASIVEGFSSRNGWSQSGGASVFRKEGLAIDDLVDQLRQDPKWQALIETDADLLTALDDIARAGPTSAGRMGDLEHLLAGAGVEPGAPWWSAIKGNTIEMQAPVDLRTVKESLRPIYDELMARYPVARQEASAGLKALENIVNGPDYAPLSTVDANLGAIKSIARTDLPELRSVEQGTAAQAVKQLDETVRLAAFDLGEPALDALEAGRKATIAKYGAGDVLEAIRAEPVQAFQQATFARDAGVSHLRAIAKQAPGELPKIGRAFLDDLLGQATKQGGFEHAAAIAAKWEKLGPQTKALLYKDPAYVRQLDQFFTLAKRTAANANPSGTAHTLLVAGQGGLFFTNPVAGIGTAIGTAALSKFLHSPIGVRLLTRGFRIPVGHKAAATAWAAEVANFAEKNGIALAPAMAEETPAARPGATVRR